MTDDPVKTFHEYLALKGFDAMFAEYVSRITGGKVKIMEASHDVNNWPSRIQITRSEIEDALSIAIQDHSSGQWDSPRYLLERYLCNAMKTVLAEHGIEVRDD